ncbi:Pr6Pr family membrane protein [Brevundimonas sp. NIBR11]|uniref:Pr6Pr family membrane protein n=1 Tax=Brevundimonas sp. NIBR11 TaxID=3015999 RepID=UPI0022F126FC|nr:Pr6Pr family membrane protein [Brevundimonas sp. NIBR11]WGM32012.1 hypothetical protein KKHFBJBL_02263 [Brevundimonas sp. NIBR11]
MTSGLRFPAAARVVAGLIALAAITGEVLFFEANRAVVGGDRLAALWEIAAYLTDWSNVAVALLFAGAALGVPQFQRGAALGVGVTILLAVGIGYAALGGWSGLADKALTDILTHVVTPWACLVFWVAFVRPPGIDLKAAARWLIYPATYFAYAVVRSVSAGDWPYPFMDPAKVGWIGVLGFSLGMTALAGVIGLAFVGLARLQSRARR